MKTFNITVSKGRAALAMDAEILLGTRALVQGKSGSGKSHLVRVIVEQTISHGLQTIIFDPSADFKTLREKCDLLIAGNQGEGADVPLEIRSAKQLLRRVAETGISCVLDMSDLSKKDRREFVRIALETLHNLPRKYWSPRIIVIDECQEYAPESGKGKSTSLEAVIETANQGRKRGHCLIAVTLRLSALSKDVTAELQNKFIGNTDHIDLKRAQDTLGSTVEQRESLRKLKPGTYFATGPALNDPDLVLFEGCASQTTHPKPGTQQKLTTPPPSRAVKAKILKEFEALPPSKEAEETQNLTQAKAEISRLSRELTKAQKTPGEPDRWKDAGQVNILRKRLEVAEAAVVEAGATGVQHERRRITKPLQRIPSILRALSKKPLADVPQALEDAAVAVETLLLDPGEPPAFKPTKTPPPSAVGERYVRTGKLHVVSDRSKQRFADEPSKLPFTWSSAPGKLLTVLLQYQPQPLEQRRMAALAGVNWKSSTFRNALTKMRSANLVCENGKLMSVHVDVAEEFADAVEPLPGGSDLLEGWRRRLGGVPLAIFDSLVARGGVGSREAVCDAAGADPNLSTARNAFTKLRNLGLLENGRGDLKLNEHVMEAMRS